MGIGSSIAESRGVTEKAVLEIADFNVKKEKENAAPKPSAGVVPGGGFVGAGSFNKDIIKGALKGAGLDLASMGADTDDGFDEYGNIQRYRYNVMFNPEEISITGYGGEEIPTNEYNGRRGGPQEGQKPPEGPPPPGPHGPHGPHRPSSRMATPQTRIDFSVRIVLDKTDPQNAFYGDKFTLGQTSIAMGAAKAVIRGVSKDKNQYTVQPDVEALTAAVRDRKKRLCRFIWGDMIYEGLLSSVSADYVMFNINGEPCRAFVTINMVLYDQGDLPASKSLWEKEYTDDFSSGASIRARAKALTVHMGEI